MEKFKTESELAAKLIELLSRDYGNIYQEVKFLERRADILIEIPLEKTSLSWIIETKLHANFDLLEQARGWRYVANYVSVCAAGKYHNEFKSICRFYGIGVIQLFKFNSEYDEIVVPELNRKSLNEMLLDMSDAQKKWNGGIAGSLHSDYYTPFKETRNNCIYYVKTHEGCTLKELIDNISHHYFTKTGAVQGISKRIDQGIIPLYKGGGRPMRIYSSKEAAETAKPKKEYISLLDMIKSV